MPCTLTKGYLRILVICSVILVALILVSPSKAVFVGMFLLVLLFNDDRIFSRSHGFEGQETVTPVTLARCGLPLVIYEVIGPL